MFFGKNICGFLSNIHSLKKQFRTQRVNFVLSQYIAMQKSAHKVVHITTESCSFHKLVIGRCEITYHIQHAVRQSDAQHSLE